MKFSLNGRHVKYYVILTVISAYFLGNTVYINNGRSVVNLRSALKIKNSLTHFADRLFVIIIFVLGDHFSCNFISLNDTVENLKKPSCDAVGMYTDPSVPNIFGQSFSLLAVLSICKKVAFIPFTYMSLFIQFVLIYNDCLIDKLANAVDIFYAAPRDFTPCQSLQVDDMKTDVYLFWIMTAISVIVMIANKPVLASGITYH